MSARCSFRRCKIDRDAAASWIQEGGGLAALLTANRGRRHGAESGHYLPNIATPTDVFVAILKSRVMADDLDRQVRPHGIIPRGADDVRHPRGSWRGRCILPMSRKKSDQGDGGRYQSLSRPPTSRPICRGLDRLNRTLNVSKAGQNRLFLERQLNETMETMAKAEGGAPGLSGEEQGGGRKAQSGDDRSRCHGFKGQIGPGSSVASDGRLPVAGQSRSLRVRSVSRNCRKQLGLMESGKGSRGTGGRRLHPAMVTVPDLALQYGRLLRVEGAGRRCTRCSLRTWYEQAKITELVIRLPFGVLDPPVPADGQIKPRPVFYGRRRTGGVLSGDGILRIWVGAAYAGDPAYLSDLIKLTIFQSRNGRICAISLLEGRKSPVVTHSHLSEWENGMAVPVSQMYTVTKYVLTQKLRGSNGIPLIARTGALVSLQSRLGCGKIQYPDHVLG